MTKKQIEKLNAVLEIAIDSGEPAKLKQAMNDIEDFLIKAYELFIFETYAEKDKIFRQIINHGLEYQKAKAA